MPEITTTTLPGSLIGIPYSESIVAEARPTMVVDGPADLGDIDFEPAHNVSYGVSAMASRDDVMVNGNIAVTNTVNIENVNVVQLGDPLVEPLTIGLFSVEFLITSPGAIAFDIVVYNNTPTDPVVFSVVGNGVIDPPSWMTFTLDDAVEGDAYSMWVEASDIRNTTSISLLSGSLPPGLTLNPAGGMAEISGTPTQNGYYVFRLRASNAGGNTDQDFAIHVHQEASEWDLLTTREVSFFGNELVPSELGPSYDPYDAVKLLPAILGPTFDPWDTRPAQTQFFDEFDRADNTSLGPSYSEYDADFEIISQKVYKASGDRGSVTIDAAVGTNSRFSIVELQGVEISDLTENGTIRLGFLSTPGSFWDASSVGYYIQNHGTNLELCIKDGGSHGGWGGGGWSVTLPTGVPFDIAFVARITLDGEDSVWGGDPYVRLAVLVNGIPIHWGTLDYVDHVAPGQLGVELTTACYPAFGADGLAVVEIDAVEVYHEGDGPELWAWAGDGSDVTNNNGTASSGVSGGPPQFSSGNQLVVGDPVHYSFNTTLPSSPVFTLSYKVRPNSGSSLHLLNDVWFMSANQNTRIGRYASSNSDNGVGDAALLVAFDRGQLVTNYMSLYRVDGASYTLLAQSASNTGFTGQEYPVQIKVRRTTTEPLVTVLFNGVVVIPETACGNAAVPYGEYFGVFNEGSGVGSTPLTDNYVREFTINQGL